MITKTITYTDYNGVERTEDFMFNLSKAEFAEMELSVNGGFSAYLEKIANAKRQVDAREATLGLEPLEDLAADVDAVAVRRIIQGTRVVLRFELHHRRCAFQHVVRDQILADD